MNRFRRKMEARRALQAPKEPLQWLQPAAAERTGALQHRKISIMALPNLDLDSPPLMPDLAKQFKILKTEEEALAERRKSRASQRRSRRLSSREPFVKQRKGSSESQKAKTAAATASPSRQPTLPTVAASPTQPHWLAKELKKQSVREKRVMSSPLSINVSPRQVLSPRGAFSAPTTPRSPRTPLSGKSPLFDGILKMFGHERTSPPASPSHARLGNISGPSLVSNTWDPSLAAKAAAAAVANPSSPQMEILSPPLPSLPLSPSVPFPPSPAKVAFSTPNLSFSTPLLKSSPPTAVNNLPTVRVAPPSLKRNQSSSSSILLAPIKRNFGPVTPAKSFLTIPTSLSPTTFAPKATLPPVDVAVEPIPSSPTLTESSFAESEIDTPLHRPYSRVDRFPSTRASTSSSRSSSSAETFSFFDDEEEAVAESNSDSSKLFAEADSWLSVGQTLMGLGFSGKEEGVNMDQVLDVKGLRTKGIIGAFPLPNQPTTPDHSFVAATPPLVWTKRIATPNSTPLLSCESAEVDSDSDTDSVKESRERPVSQDSIAASLNSYAGSLFDMYAGSEENSRRSSAATVQSIRGQPTLQPNAFALRVAANKRNTFGSVHTLRSRPASLASLITSPSLDSTPQSLAELHKLMMQDIDVEAGAGPCSSHDLTRESSLDGALEAKIQRWTLKEIELARVLETGKPAMRKDRRKTKGSVRKMPLSYR